MFPTEKIGKGNPYHRCIYCKLSVPAINYKIEGHLDTCVWRRAVELGVELLGDGTVPEDAELGDYSYAKREWVI